MQAKTFEIRDSGTFIAALAVKCCPESEHERYMLARTGYGVFAHEQSRYVLLMNLAGGEGRFDCDVFGWGSGRTMHIAHKYISENFDALVSGAVVDVQFILGETAAPKESEAVALS